jgi:phosphatidylinositol glycan class N
MLKPIANMYFSLYGGILMFAVGAVYLLFEERITANGNPQNRKQTASALDIPSRIIFGCQMGLVALAMIVTRSSVITLQARQGLGSGNIYVGWFTLGKHISISTFQTTLIDLVASLVLPTVYRRQSNRHYLQRLAVIFLQFAPTFIILTISYEGLFYFAFCMCLFSWMRLEHSVYLYTNKNAEAAIVKANPVKAAVAAAENRLQAIKKGDYRSLTLADARIALFFFFFIQSAFFSASNIASVSSFSLDAVYRLVPIFDPFSQGALLMLKLMVPFAALSANFGLLNRRLGVAPSALFMVVMAVSDVMTLSFFYMVKDEGSWLDIGTTISHFVIASLLGVFVAGLELVSESIIGGVEFEEAYAEESVKTVNGKIGNGEVNGKGGGQLLKKEETSG